MMRLRRKIGRQGTQRLPNPNEESQREVKLLSGQPPLRVPAAEDTMEVDQPDKGELTPTSETVHFQAPSFSPTEAESDTSFDFWNDCWHAPNPAHYSRLHLGV